ncbi:MAG: DUF2752 domain-containing protein [Planctomycetes bacterium]|nr:DUF2752 domain-containing protein [Planctomycetota bacterium]
MQEEGPELARASVAPTSPDRAPAVGSAPSVEHRVLFAGANLALVVLVAFALFVEPDPRGFGTHEKLGLPPCAPMELWNVPCPGCGVTTSFTLAAHGRLLASFVNQPLGAAIAVGVPLFALWAWRVHLKRGDLRDELSRRATWPWAVGVTVLVTVAWLYKLARVRGWIA